MASPPPLMGYNTNVRHKGKLYHLQTEDSGVDKPHIITHLFADGGRILASKKTSYAEHVGKPDYKDIVKALMQDQHKGVFIELRDGVYDEPEAEHDAELEKALEDTIEGLGQERAKRLGLFLPVSPALDTKKVETEAGMLNDPKLDELIHSYISERL